MLFRGEKMNFVAHFKHTKDGTIVTQSVQEHCRNTANIAAEKMKCVNLDKAAYLAGLMHDMGKCHEIDPIQTDTSDSKFLFNNEDAIVVNFKKNKKDE